MVPYSTVPYIGMVLLKLPTGQIPQSLFPHKSATLIIIPGYIVKNF